VPGAADGAIRFRCPRCLTRLKAPASRAGKRQRCPRCQLVVEVPPRSKPDRTGEEYPVWEGADPPLAGPQAYIAVTCPVCQTRIAGTPEQVGQQVRCPDCGTTTIMPPPAVKKTPPRTQLEEYALCEDLEDPPADPPAAEQKHIPVYCPLCNTLMQCTEDEVGQVTVCPDCGTSTVVHPPAPAAKKGPADFRVGAQEEYALAEGEDQPPPGSVAYQPQIAVVCFVCGTRMHATADQVGQEIVCPDCGIVSVVPPPVERRPPRYDLDGTEYAAGQGAELPEYQSPGEYRWVGHTASPEAEGEEEHERELPRRRAAPIRWPMLRGVFTFPLYRSVWLRCVVMSVLAVALAYGACGAITLSAQAPKVVAGAGAEYAAPLMGSMMLTAVVGILGLMWAAVMSVSCLAIIGDTAAGNDQIENWPDPARFVDWIGEAFYLGNSALLSTAPGLGIAWAVNSNAPPYWAAAPISLLVMLPILLLSMLEAGSPLNPISPAVWWSFGAAWWAWGLFYFETAILAAALAGLGWVVVEHYGLPGLAPASVVLVPALFIYFRLLGRLAWCCKEAALKAERAATESAEVSDEDEPPLFHGDIMY